MTTICLASCISSVIVPRPLQAYWYHKGELNPKFKTLLYYNLIIITVLCLVAVLYFYDTAMWASYRHTVHCNQTLCQFFT